MQLLKKALLEAFEIKDLGEKHYIKELVYEHHIGKTADVPASGYEKLTKAEPEEPLTNENAYQTLISKLNWLIRAIRPDIAFVTQKLSQHAYKPTERHIAGA
ncbi:hypothetical protein M433DRAFT_159760, partial [Acidomyces richmondensis BFW]